MVVYQAGPLFSDGERMWHKKLKKKLEFAGHSVIWPYEVLSDEEIKKAGNNAPKLICETDLKMLLKSDVVIALLDGSQVDDGTAFEIGYAVAKTIPVIGVRTDFRQAGETRFSTVNAMIEASCHCIVHDTSCVIAELGKLKM